MSPHLSGTRPATAAGALRRTFTLVVGLAAGVAGAQTARADLTVTVLAEHFVVADRSFDDLDRLADVVTAMRPNEITLSACGPAVTRSLKAAAHRFQDLPLRLNVLWTGEPGCPDASITPASARRVRQGPNNLNEDAVDRYWDRLVP